MIIYDCDGVLVDSEAVCIRVEREALADAGVHYDHGSYVRRFMGMEASHWERALRADVVARGHPPLPADFFARLDAALTAALEQHMSALPGARDAITAPGDLRCVASSTSQPQLDWKLERAGLADLFGSRVYSADLVEHGKPAPDLFLHAAEDMGVDPASCVVVEDSANGVAAGVAAGMRVIGFVGGDHCVDGHADELRAAGAMHIVDHFRELPSAIGVVREAGGAMPDSRGGRDVRR